MPDTAAQTPDLDLTGQFLIAMPGMGDPRFSHSVVFVCAHTPEAAMGLIVNKPPGDVHLGQVMEQLDITASDDVARRPLHFGGPVETGRGFVLHGDDYDSALHSLRVVPGLCMTATIDVLEDIAKGDGPAQSLVCLGYSGWGPGQLDQEILANGWLTSPADPTIVFDMPDARKWQAAVESLGIDPLGLSGTAGRA